MCVAAGGQGCIVVFSLSLAAMYLSDLNVPLLQTGPRQCDHNNPGLLVGFWPWKMSNRPTKLELPPAFTRQSPDCTQLSDYVLCRQGPQFSELWLAIMARDKIHSSGSGPRVQCWVITANWTHRRMSRSQDNSAESYILCPAENKFIFRSNVMRMLINKTNCFSKVIVTDDGSSLIVYRSGWVCVVLISARLIKDRFLWQTANKLVRVVKNYYWRKTPVAKFDKTGSWDEE